jgi:hypothetical protein
VLISAIFQLFKGINHTKSVKSRRSLGIFNFFIEPIRVIYQPQIWRFFAFGIGFMAHHIFGSRISNGIISCLRRQIDINTQPLIVSITFDAWVLGLLFNVFVFPCCISNQIIISQNN